MAKDAVETMTPITDEINTKSGLKATLEVRKRQLEQELAEVEAALKLLEDDPELEEKYQQLSRLSGAAVQPAPFQQFLGGALGQRFP